MNQKRFFISLVSILAINQISQSMIRTPVSRMLNQPGAGGSMASRFGTDTTGIATNQQTFMPQATLNQSSLQQAMQQPTEQLWTDQKMYSGGLLKPTRPNLQKTASPENHEKTDEEKSKRMGFGTKVAIGAGVGAGGYFYNEHLKHKKWHNEIRNSLREAIIHQHIDELNNLLNTGVQPSFQDIYNAIAPAYSGTNRAEAIETLKLVLAKVDNFAKNGDLTKAFNKALFGDHQDYGPNDTELVFTNFDEPGPRYIQHDTIKACIDSGKIYMTPLAAAVLLRDKEKIKSIIHRHTNDSDPNMFKAIVDGDQKKFQKSHLNLANWDGITPLMVAVALGDRAMVNHIIAQGADVDKVTSLPGMMTDTAVPAGLTALKIAKLPMGPRSWFDKQDNTQIQGIIDDLQKARQEASKHRTLSMTERASD